jgi:hypothetical protein
VTESYTILTKTPTLHKKLSFHPKNSPCVWTHTFCAHIRKKWTEKFTSRYCAFLAVVRRPLHRRCKTRNRSYHDKTQQSSPKTVTMATELPLRGLHLRRSSKHVGCLCIYHDSPVFVLTAHNQTTALHRIYVVPVQKGTMRTSCSVSQGNSIWTELEQIQVSLILKTPYQIKSSWRSRTRSLYSC